MVKITKTASVFDAKSPGNLCHKFLTMKKGPAYIALLLVSFFWGTTYLASRIGVEYAHGFMLAGIRQAIAGVIMLLIVCVIMRKKFASGADLWKIPVIGLIMLTGSNGIMTWAMEYIPSGLAAIIAATVPIWITFFSLLLLPGTRVSWQLAVGILLGFAGVAGIFSEYFELFLLPEFTGGIILAVVASMLWALGSVLSAVWKPGADPLVGAGIQMLAGGLGMLLVAGLTGGSFVRFVPSPQLWWSLVYLVIFGSLVAYTAYVYVLTKLSPAVASVYAYINPLVAVFLGWMVLNETLTFRTVIATLVTLGGVYIINNSPKKRVSEPLKEYSNS